MEKELLLSLCIPTNGVIEWVIPVLDSIFDDCDDITRFEVVITDNGNDPVFEKTIKLYKQKHKNIVYKKTEAKMFLNQIESFKLARGKFIKFINHRMTLKVGTLKYFIKFVEDYKKTKPLVYFSNGMLRLAPRRYKCDSFDEYVRALSYWSSWSAGTAMWKEDFMKIDLNKSFNSIFPHTDLLFSERNRTYIVDDEILLNELPINDIKKGNYDLFNAFAVEYPCIIEHLYKEGDISKNTYNYIKHKNGFFVSQLYAEYVLMKTPCSYCLDGFDVAMGKYYNKVEIVSQATIIELKKSIGRLIKRDYNKKKQ